MGSREVLPSNQKIELSRTVLGSGFLGGLNTSLVDHFNPAASAGANETTLQLYPRTEVKNFRYNTIGCLPVDFRREGMFSGHGGFSLLRPISAENFVQNSPLGLEDSRFHVLGDEEAAVTYTDFCPKRKGTEARIGLTYLGWSVAEARWQERERVLVSPRDVCDKDGVFIPPDQGKYGWFFHRPMRSRPKEEFGWSIEAIPFLNEEGLPLLGQLADKDWARLGNRSLISPDKAKNQTHVGMSAPPIFLERRDNGEEVWACLFHPVTRTAPKTLVYSTHVARVVFNEGRTQIRVEKTLPFLNPSYGGHLLREGWVKRIIFTTGAVLTQPPNNGNGREFYNFSFFKPNRGQARQMLLVSGDGDRQIRWDLVDFSSFCDQVLAA